MGMFIRCESCTGYCQVRGHAVVVVGHGERDSTIPELHTPSYRKQLL